jgi:ribonuclease BN (tRNA processing enzyme)
MEVTLLGSGGWIPTSRRETSCLYAREGSRALLLDAGSGVSRLVEERALLVGVDRLDILLTHFHLDHVIGLSYLPALAISDPPAVWGPGKALAGAATREILGRLLEPPLFGSTVGELVSETREIVPGDLVLEGWDVSTRLQRRHPGGSLAFRIGDDLAFCTDTAFDSENASFASGVRVLCHEAWYAAGTTEDPAHSAAGDAGRLAASASAGHLVLVHVRPIGADEPGLARHAATSFPGVVVGTDLLELGG